MAEQAPIITQERTLLWPEDPVGNYTRYEIDRDPLLLDMDFSRAIGSENTPIAIAHSIVEKSGHVTILDAGCGTGHTLFEYVEGLQHLYGASSVTALGVNKEDYSRESRYAAVRAAYRDNKVPYVVADIESLPLHDDVFDLVYSYEVFQHNEEPQKLLDELVRVLKPKGRLLFNADPLQTGHPLLQDAVSSLQEQEYKIEQGRLQKGTQEREFYSIEKPRK